MGAVVGVVCGGIEQKGEMVRVTVYAGQSTRLARERSTAEWGLRVKYSADDALAGYHPRACRELPRLGVMQDLSYWITEALL